MPPPAGGSGSCLASSTASSIDSASTRKKPPSASFVSAYGPSVTSVWPSWTRTVVAEAVDSSSSPPCRMPRSRARRANAVYCATRASRSPSLTASQLFSSAWIISRYRIVPPLGGAEALGQQTVREMHALVGERMPLARRTNEFELPSPHDLALGGTAGLFGVA